MTHKTTSVSIRISSLTHHKLSHLSAEVNVSIKDLIEVALEKTYFNADSSTIVPAPKNVPSVVKYKLEQMVKDINLLIGTIGDKCSDETVPIEVLRTLLDNYTAPQQLSSSKPALPDWLE